MAVTETGAPVNSPIGAPAQIVDVVSFSVSSVTGLTTVTAGSIQTITTNSWAGVPSGSWAIIDDGQASEAVQILSITSTSLMAFFSRAHTNPYSIKINIARQIVSIGSPSVQTQIAEVDAYNRVTAILSRPNASATTSKSASASSATLVATRPGRMSLTIYNSSSTINAYISEGGGIASINPGGYAYLMPPGSTLDLVEEVFTGIYYYISDSADGSYLNITERY